MLGGGVVAWPEEHVMSPAASRWLPMILSDTADARCARFLPWMLFGQPLLFAQCDNLDICLYYVAVQNLVYGCGNVPQTTAESSDIPLIHSAQYVQQSVDMYIQLPTGLECNPVQIAEVIQ